MLEINVKITIEPVLNADESQLDLVISFDVETSEMKANHCSLCLRHACNGDETRKKICFESF